MRLLLDTHMALWLVRDADELGASARRLIADADTVHFSSASLWEATIKVGLGKLPLDPRRLAEQLERAGVLPLAVAWQHALAVHQLPPLHKDPFDRLLIAQAVVEPMHLLTHDRTLAGYSPLVLVH